VEERTGVELRRCIDWHKLWQASAHIPGLWNSPDEFVA